jgi:putative flippase GtrA
MLPPRASPGAKISAPYCIVLFLDDSLDRMKSLLLSLLRTRRQFVVYCVIGVTGVTLDYCSFYALVNWIGVYYLAANAVSTSIGILNNFFLNSYFNFKVQDRWIGRLVSFYAIGMLGLGVSSVLLFVMVSRMGMNPNYSKLGTLIVVVLLQYNLNRVISFRKAKP